MGAEVLAVFVVVCLEITSTRAFSLPNAGPWQCHERTARLLLSDAGTRSVRFVSSRPTSCSSSLPVRMRLGHADIEGELNASPDSGRATHDRVTELFADSLSNRPWEALFTALATSSTFRDKMWNKEPFLVEAGAAGTAGSSFVTRSFGMDDVAQYIGQYPHQYAAQGTLSPDGKGGWYMKKVGMANGQNAMMTFADVQDALTKGTVVLNSAGAYLSPLAAISLATLESFQMPVGLNVYITAPGMKMSAPPHTDKQDVFVLQTQGSKHWRVFAPPPPSNKKGADAYARGKGPDQLSLDELQAPLIETNLKEGQMLYIPAGYPHTTDTLSEGQSGPSLHLTIGLDTHIWGLDYAFLREVALRRQKMKTLFQLAGVDRDATALDSALYFSLTEPLPLGFLSSSLLHTRPLPSPLRSRLAQGEADLQVIIESMTASLAAKIKAAEPQRFTESEAALIEKLDLSAACQQAVLHYRKVVEIQRRMYLDGKHALTPAPNSLLRVQHYMTLLDGVMQSMIQWSSGASAAPAASQVVPPAAAAGISGGGGGGKGMGGGGASKDKAKAKKGGFG